MRDECEHGSLRRCCEICDRDAEIDRLKADLEDAREKLSEEKDAARYWQDKANEEAGSLESERLFHLKKIDDLKAELVAARDCIAMAERRAHEANALRADAHGESGRLAAELAKLRAL